MAPSIQRIHRDIDPPIYNQRLQAANQRRTQQIEIPQGYHYGTDYNTLHMIPNLGYQGTRNFNPQMGQQLQRNSNSNADELLLSDWDDEESVWFETKRADLLVQTPISRVVWFGRSSYELQALRFCQVHWPRQYKHDRACQSVSYTIGRSISWGYPSSSFLLLVPVRTSLHLVLIVAS